MDIRNQFFIQELDFLIECERLRIEGLKDGEKILESWLLPADMRPEIRECEARIRKLEDEKSRAIRRYRLISEEESRNPKDLGLFKE